MSLDKNQYKQIFKKTVSRSKSRELKILARSVQDEGLNISALAAAGFHEIFVLDETMPDADKAARVAEVRSQYWSGLNNRQTKESLQAVEALVESVEAKGGSVESPDFWAEYFSAAQEERKGRLAAVVQGIVEEYGSYGAVPKVTFEEIVKVEGDRSLVEEELRVKKVHVVDALDVDAVDAPKYRKVVKGLHDLHVGNLGNFLGLPLQTQIFGTTPAVKVSAIKAKRDEVGKLAHKAEGKVETENLLATLEGFLKGTSDQDEALVEVIREVAIVQAMEVMRAEPLRSGRTAALQRLNFHEADVGLLMLSLSSVSGGPQDAVNPLNEAISSLSAGELLAAERQFGVAEPTVDSEEKYDSFAAKLKDVRSQVDGLVAQAKQAKAHGDHSQAEQLLLRAQDSAHDDPAIIAELEKLPPEPVKNLRAQITDTGVVLQWDGAARAQEYQVQRSVSGLAQFLGNYDATTATDENPPVAVDVSYSVTAVSASVSAAPAEAKVRIIPRVSRLQTASDGSTVQVSWRAPDGAQSVRVAIFEGAREVEAVEVVNKSSYVFSTVEPFSSYRVTAAAVFAVGTQTVESEPAVSHISVRPEATPVNDLTVSPGGYGDAVAVWTDVPGYSTAAFVLEKQPQFKVGQKVPVSDLDQGGDRVYPMPGVAGKVQAKVSSSRRQYWVVIATLDGDEALVGSINQQAQQLPIKNVDIQRRGQQIAISWTWPSKSGLVEANWDPDLDDAEPIVTRLTFADYDRVGALLMDVGGLGGTLSLVHITKQNGRDVRSAPVAETLAGSQGSAQYTIAIKKPLFGDYAAQLKITAESAISDGVVQVSLCHGQFFPAQPQQILQESPLDLAKDESVEQTITLGKIKTAFWVRCFAKDSTKLVLADPADTSAMKGR